MRLTRCIRWTDPFTHSDVDRSEREGADTRDHKRIVGHPKCTPKRVAGREFFYEKINWPLGSDKPSILLLTGNYFN